MNADRIRQIAAWLATTDIGQLELRGPGKSLVLRNDSAAVSVVDEAAPLETLTVTAPSLGVFLHRHPLREGPLAAPGTAVQAGQTIGLLQVGPLLLPVAAPADATVHELLAAHGTTVGYGTPLLLLLDKDPTMDIDLNADLGEGYGAWRMGDDEALLEVLSSANIACGFHAGDPLIMERTVRVAGARGVDIGAHVGFPDRQGFGRRVMQIDPAELAPMVTYQLGALAGIARAAGQRMTHMSFHGALGNQAAADATLAAVLVRAVAAFDASLIVSSSSSVAIEGAAAENGLRVATAFLADRAYDDQGLLVPRRLPNSVLHGEGEVLARVRRLLADGTVTTYSGHSIPMRPRSILVHGDTPGALALARTLRDEIEAGGGRIVPISRQLA